MIDVFRNLNVKLTRKCFYLLSSLKLQCWDKAVEVQNFCFFVHVQINKMITIMSFSP